MSWTNERDDHGETNLSNEHQWKIGLTKIENCFKNIKKLHDDIKGKFDYIERSQIDMKEIEMRRQNFNPMLEEMTNYISHLEKMVPSSQTPAEMAMRNQIKDLRRRAADLTSLVQQLSLAINKELDKRQFARKKELSVINNTLGDEETAMPRTHQVQMTTLDPQQLMAEEELRQAQQITSDMVTLENIFMHLSTMVTEQGEGVTRIEANVENAYTNVESAEKELTKAVVYKRAAFKKKLMIIGIVLAILVIIGLIIGLSVGLKKS